MSQFLGSVCLKKLNDFWCLRTESNRHGAKPQGILSVIKLVTHGQLLQYIPSIIFLIIPCCDISYQNLLPFVPEQLGNIL